MEDIFVYIHFSLQSTFGMPSKHILIKGKVQGVFYRATAKKEAEKMGITGWVRNTSKGDVEIMSSGNEAQLELFIEWCKIGPQRAEVASVLVTHLDEISFQQFEIKR